MKYLILISLIAFSCTSTQKVKNTTVKGVTTLYNEGPWKSNFKNMVFSDILYKMYGKEFFDCCLKKDASGTANFDWLNFDTTITNKATQLSEEFMKRPYLNGNIEGRKVMMNYALKYRNSHELDSITGVYYRQFQSDLIQREKNNN